MKYVLGWLCLSFTLLAGDIFASELKGRVVKVADGDTITIIDANNTQHRIRLSQIDAPEKGQPWGEKSRQYLAQRIAGEEVTVEWNERDRYQRIIGTVYLDSVDICQEQIELGNAWVYTQYATDKTLYLLQNQAERNKIGLWKLPASERVEPWVWRRNKNGHRK